MITDRDIKIISFIENIGYATINHINLMFFSNSKYGYDLARKRLKKISEMGKYIKAISNKETSELIYIPFDSKIKGVSIHNIKVIDYVCNLNKLGCTINMIELEPVFNTIKPDAYLQFEFNGYLYHQLVEVQMRHDVVDLTRFVPFDTVDSILQKTDNVMPNIIIIQNTNKDYEKDNITQFSIIQLSLDMENIAKVLC